VNDATNTRHIEIGKIEIMKKFSFFEIDRQYEGNILRSFKQNITFSGVRVLVELSKPDPSGSKRQEQSKKKKHKPDISRKKNKSKKGKFRS
jgi:ATP-dependent RNA helicase DeaD